MSRESYRYDHVTGELVTAQEYAARKYRRTPRRRSDLKSPNLIGDFSEPLVNPSDGQRYHSKRAYDKATARNGAVNVAGEQHNLAKLRPQTKRVAAGQHIKAAIQELGKKAWLP